MDLNILLALALPILALLGVLPNLSLTFHSTGRADARQLIRTLADMKTARRISIVVICYLLSSYGILGSLMVIAMSGIRSLGGTLVGFLIFFAWVCHIVMSINWVSDKPVKKWVPVYGTLAGILGLMFWPVADSSTQTFVALDIFRAAAMGLVFTLPCFLLAIYLVQFHLRAQSESDNKHVS